MDDSESKDDRAHFDHESADWENIHDVQALSDLFCSVVMDEKVLRDGVRVLDYGGGTGLTSRKLVKLAIKETPSIKNLVFTVVDLSEKMIAEGKKNAAADAEMPTDVVSLHFDLVTDAATGSLPFTSPSFGNNTNQFDVILCSNVLHHVPETRQQALFNQLCALLSPNGRLLLGELQHLQHVHEHNHGHHNHHHGDTSDNGKQGEHHHHQHQQGEAHDHPHHLHWLSPEKLQQWANEQEMKDVKILERKVEGLTRFVVLNDSKIIVLSCQK